MVAIATAEFQLREGNVEAAARTLENARSLAGPPTEQERMAQARLLLAEHSPSMAWKVLTALEESAQQQQSNGSLIAIYVLQALCKRTLGQHAGARQCVENAVSLAASAGYRRVFLNEGANIIAMLEQARHVAPAFVSSLLAPDSSGLDLPPAGPLLEPLSKVELEILSLLNRGLTNQEIGKAWDDGRHDGMAHESDFRQASGPKSYRGTRASTPAQAPLVRVHRAMRLTFDR